MKRSADKCEDKRPAASRSATADRGARGPRVKVVGDSGMGSLKCCVGRASRSPSSATYRTKDRPLAAKHTTDGAPAPDDAATDSDARADCDRAVRRDRYQAVERAFAGAAAHQ